VIVAYAKGFGAVGWGVIESPDSYELIKTGSRGDKLNGTHLHRLSINWKATAQRLEDGVRPDVLREEFGIFHPLSTSVRIDDEKAQNMIDRLNTLFQ